MLTGVDDQSTDDGRQLTGKTFLLSGAGGLATVAARAACDDADRAGRMCE
jgi:hypothetical protein